jgi:hypothetical protein
MIEMRTVCNVVGPGSGSSGCVPRKRWTNGSNYPEITIPGAPDHGIFDPSVAGNGAGKLYMTLSGVASTIPGGGFDTLAVRTYLASSSDRGKTWQLGGVVSPDVQVKVKGDRGSWQSGSHRPSFMPQRSRWKVVWHQYLAVRGPEIYPRMVTKRPRRTRGRSPETLRRQRLR